jgi:hypothetical protein
MGVGGGGGKGAKYYVVEKAWSSINNSILSAVKCCTEYIVCSREHKSIMEVPSCSKFNLLFAKNRIAYGNC